MNNLELIAKVNPIWAIKIFSFIEEYPEFKPYVYLAPLNPIQPIPYKNVNTLFQSIIHYICAVGVRYSYAYKQWEIIFPFINCDNWDTIMENSLQLQNNSSIQNKKREIYYNLCRFMNEHNITHKTINISHLNLLQQNVAGIGDGCVAWCKKYFTLDDDCVEYTDITFKKGFQRIYNTDSVSIRKKNGKRMATKKLWKSWQYYDLTNWWIFKIKVS
jgi:hypothetical protein